MGFTGIEHHPDPNRNPNDDRDTNLNSDHHPDPNTSLKHDTHTFLLLMNQGTRLAALVRPPLLQRSKS